ncbi:hypothetical protein [Gimesia fumaroli]|uniref:Uncharacterized protein n=1 Tax=Gimesia fumaroli TaxID=2527976 RepID=A0A518IB56_9PLAN|nr:hypothetical protein [Gimesia fumaroli]QDV50337.1 hypothetical protein Enr17x_23750 [Gimesia fumaroli]
MNDPTPASDDTSTAQTLPYTEAEIETMATEDASAGRFLTKMLVFTFCYTIIVGGYVIYWSLNS